MSKTFTIKNRKGQLFEAIVDDNIYDEVMKYQWNAHSVKGKTVHVVRGHVVNGKRTTIGLHQFIMGPAPIGMVIDHINNSGLDNRRANLRFCTVAENNSFKTSQGVLYKRHKRKRDVVGKPLKRKGAIKTTRENVPIFVSFERYVHLMSGETIR